MRNRIDTSHLERRAYVYVRQSTAAQVFAHGESTQRQYGLVDRAVALGWARDAVEVIDEDQGRSGATVAGRAGFARLADAVAHGQAGAVFAVEVSRLARCSQDWQQLLALCAVARVVVVDEQTVYDPNDHDAKLLLDLKGTMSEAELHWLGLRLTGARQHKARRGALRLAAPTGYVWTDTGFALDPDEAVRAAVRAVFARYVIEPTACAVVRWARANAFLFPTRRTWDTDQSEVVWKPLGVSRLYEMLRNPVYAGAYVYGRRPLRTVLVEGQIRRVRDPGSDHARWTVCRHDAHPGYITWATYLRHQTTLRENQARFGGVGRGAPREGAAVLSGLLLCGRCGRRMRTVSRGRATRQGAYYACGGDRAHGQATCWSVPGAPLDAAITAVFLATVVPPEVELALAVEQDAQGQATALAQQWRLRIEQASYEARRAERRYKAVDPDNRVVARTLEREWESRLQDLAQIERQYDTARQQKHVDLTPTDRIRLRALARDLPAVWRAPTTNPADRQAMLRLVIEAIALTPVEVPERTTRVQIQWQSGTLTTLLVPRPDRRTRRRTPDAALERIRARAATGHADDVIAVQLNAEGYKTGAGKPWTTWAVRWVRQRRTIRRTAPDAPRRHPLPERDVTGRYSVAGAAKHLGVSPEVVRRWIRLGHIPAHSAPYGPYPRVWWLEIDPATAARLTRSTSSPEP